MGRRRVRRGHRGQPARRADRAGTVVWSVDADLSLPGHDDAYAVGDAAAVPWGDPVDRRRRRSAPRWPRWPSSRAATPPARSSTAWRPSRPRRSATTTRASWPPSGGGRPSPSSPRAPIVRGTLGWLAWLGLHLVYLIGFRNKIVVLVNWSWRYLSWGSGPRIIVGDELESPATGRRPRTVRPGAVAPG